MVVGECVHLVNSFICSEGKHQNYPCPYRMSCFKCPSCVIVTENMKKEWDETGVVLIAPRN